MKINDFVICEDIREEVKRKYTLIGIFNDRIIFERMPDAQVIVWPKKVKLAAYIKLLFEKKEVGLTKFNLSFTDKVTKETLSEFNFNIVPDHDFGRSFQVVLSPLIISVKPNQILQLKVITYKGDEQVEEKASESVYEIIEEVVPTK